MKRVFKTEDFGVLTEASQHHAGKSAGKLLNCDNIIMADGSKVPPATIVNAVNRALSRMAGRHPYEYDFITSQNIFYLTNNAITDTMATDLSGNIYINVNFVWEDLGLRDDTKKAIDLIYAILYHEVLHTILTHVARGREWMNDHNAKGALSWDATNICADLEVNNIIIDDEVATEDMLEKLGAFIDRSLSGFPFETIISKYAKGELNLQKTLKEPPKKPSGNGSKQAPKKKSSPAEKAQKASDIAKKIADAAKIAASQGHFVYGEQDEA